MHTHQTDYAGIDYSRGLSNVNHATGIHYGVISQHAINPDALGDMEPDYGPATCGYCGGPAEEGCIDPEPDYPEWTDEGSDYFCRKCKRSFNSEDAFSDEACGFSYEEDGYSLADCLDSDIFVFNSPYYTFAQFCSPCVPGAGNLESPCPNGPKTYALGHDWFNGGVAPYPVYRVSDDTLVPAEAPNA